MKRLNQTGSHVLALGLLIVVLGVVGFTGYTVTHHKAKTVTNSSASTAAQVPATIQTKADLTATAQSLDNAAADVNSSVNGDSLNSNLNDML